MMVVTTQLDRMFTAHIDFVLRSQTRPLGIASENHNGIHDVRFHGHS